MQPIHHATMANKFIRLDIIAKLAILTIIPINPQKNRPLPIEPI